MATRPALPITLRRDPETGLDLCPSLEEAARLSPAELAAVHDWLDEELAAHTQGPGPMHSARSETVADAVDRLRGHFQRIGRRALVATGFAVQYPGVDGFWPDLLVVLDDSATRRTAWNVQQEGRGVDLVLDVLTENDARKGRAGNVEFYASLGIPEYLVYSIRDQSVTGWRLEAPGANRYTRIVPQCGRVPSRVLDLEFGVLGGVLRCWRNEAELPSTTELAQLLGRLVDEKEAQLAATRAAVDAAHLEAVRAARRGLDRILTLRGLEPTPAEREAIDACDDLDRLERWSDRALEVATVAALLAP